MKNFILRYSNHLYLFSLFFIFFLYFFPGDIVTYFIYGNLIHNGAISQNQLGSSIHLIINTGGYSLNHILVFIYITSLGLLTYFKNKKFSFVAAFFIFLSIFLEIIHFLIPNRSFEYTDLLSNLFGVVIGLIIFWKFKK